MAPTSISKERLDMESPTKNHVMGNTPMFTNEKLVTVRKSILYAGVIFSVVVIVIVGILCYHLAPGRTSNHVGHGAGDDRSGPDDHRHMKPKPNYTLEEILLPGDLTPLHYFVELQPYLTEQRNFTYDGFVSIIVEVAKNTKRVVLHAHQNISVIEGSVVVVEEGIGKAVGVARVNASDLDRQFLALELDGELEKGRRYTVGMNFTGILNDELCGFYRSSYRDESNQTRWLATTQFEATDARRAFPCFDEPSLKATFDIVLVRPHDMTSMSNSPIERNETRPNGYVADYYKTTAKMSTYLLAFVVSNFQCEEVDSRPKFRVCARPNALSQVKYALDIGPRILNHYEKFFSIGYPLPKQDMIALPDFAAGAMENWGLITYRETALLYDANRSSAANRQRVATVVAHELAHQWFGNLVTPKWWDDLWLNEGFASYVEFIGVDHVHKDWLMMEQFVCDEVQDVMGLDALKTSHPVFQPVTNPDQINELFDRISYGKGASIIRMMHHFLGDDVFKQGLGNYLKSLQFANSQSDDLWNHLTMASRNASQSINVKAVMDTWILQTGFPLLTVTRNYNDNSATAVQRRFVLAENYTKTNERWTIPITFTTRAIGNFNDTVPAVWFDSKQDSVKLNLDQNSAGDWLIVNLQETAYHRVHYDLDNWNLLIAQLNDNHEVIHASNRAQLLDDALNLARVGVMDYGLALNLTTYLAKELGYVPWSSAMRVFGYIQTRLELSSAYGELKQYLMKLVGRVYDTLEFKDDRNDEHINILNREDILRFACSIDHPDCLKKARSAFEDWKNNGLEPTANLKSIVACNGLKLSNDDTDWKFIWDKYVGSNVGSEKVSLLNSLACTRKPYLLGGMMDMSLNSSKGIRRQDTRYVLTSVARNPIGHDIAFKFLRNRWHDIRAYASGISYLEAAIKSVASQMNTEFELKELKEFYLENKLDFGPAERAIQQAIESTAANVRWGLKHADEVEQWLHAQVKANR